MAKTKESLIDSRSSAGMDPLEIFRALRDLFPEAFFFQSSSTPEARPELTVIGLEVEERLIVHGGHGEIRTLGQRQEFSGGALDIFSRYLQAYQSAAVTKIPFENGGAFGAVGYDLVREIEPRLQKSGYFSGLSTNASSSAPAESSQQECEVLFVKNLLVLDHKNAQAHLILKSKSGRGMQYKEQILKILSQSLVMPHKSSETPATLSKRNVLKPSLGRERFKAAVLKLKNHIRDGDIFQAVLAERFEAQTLASAFSIFSYLRQINPAAYSFYFPFQSCDFFGASPEALIKIKDGRIETHPIAGTKPRGVNSSEDAKLELELMNSDKESAEHLMLVDLARNDIGRVAMPGTVEAKTFRQVMRLSNVMHMISKVEAQLNPKYTEMEAFKACFPAGTLSGAPKIRAMEILSQLEMIPRGLYGGAIVAFDFNGGMDSCIAIRAMEVRQGLAILRAGAGVVADSDAESEYQEIEHKLATLRQALALADDQVVSSIERNGVAG